MDESTRLQGMVFCSFFHKLNQQTYTAIIQCISILYSAPFDYTYTQNGVIILKANVDFPRSFLGQSKEKSMITGWFLDHAFCFAEWKR